MKKLIYGILAVLTLINVSYSQWTVVSSPSPSTTRNILRDVTAISSNDVWTVGVYDTTSGSLPLWHNLTLHWNGSVWTQVFAPNPGPQYNELYAVKGFASNDVYAVGSLTGFPATPQMLALHWNGSSWGVMNTPTVTGGSGFETMLGFAPNDIYAGGFKAVGAPGPTTGTLVAHWDGSSWTILNTPNQSNNRTNRIEAMSGLSTNDLWAAGYSREIGANFKAMILHKVNSSWTIETLPQIGDESFIYTIDVISANDIWATGDYNDAGTLKPLFMHYNGSTWTIVNSPNGGNGIVHNSSNDIWSASSEFVHYDGNAWTEVPNAMPYGGGLFRITRVAINDFWGVGRIVSGSALNTLVMHYGNITSTGNNNNGIPSDYSLSQNYPNPFNPATQIQFAVPEAGNVSIRIYNVAGVEAATLVNGHYNPGTYTINWNASDFPSGVYLYKITSGNFTQTKKMILVK